MTDALRGKRIFKVKLEAYVAVRDDEDGPPWPKDVLLEHFHREPIGVKVEEVSDPTLVFDPHGIPYVRAGEAGDDVVVVGPLLAGLDPGSEIVPREEYLETFSER